jgi:hypothetical protein
MLGYIEGGEWHNGERPDAKPITGVCPKDLKPFMRGASFNKMVATSCRTVINDLGRVETRVRYHNTDVVCFTADRIVLDTGGWFTVTTKRRMNQAAKIYGLAFSVSQRKGKWYIQGPFDGELEFSPDGLASFERGE